MLGNNKLFFFVLFSLYVLPRRNRCLNVRISPVAGLGEGKKKDFNIELSTVIFFFPIDGPACIRSAKGVSFLAEVGSNETCSAARFFLRSRALTSAENCGIAGLSSNCRSSQIAGLASVQNEAD